MYPVESDRPPQASPAPKTAQEKHPIEEPQSKLFHDARGCLNGIQLNLTLLKRSTAGELDHLGDLRERNRGWVQAISEEVVRLQELIEQAAKASTAQPRTPKS